MALKTTKKRTSSFQSFSLISKFTEFRKGLQNKNGKKILVSKAKIGNTLSKTREKELSKFDSGFTAKVDLYARKFF